MNATNFGPPPSYDDDAPNDRPSRTRSESPAYGASFALAISRYWRKYGVFHGRASRSEYWWTVVFNAIVWFALGLGAIVTETASPTHEGSSASAIFGVPLILYLLVTLVPNITLLVRRLHDANHSGWFYFLTWIPGVGAIIAIVLALLPSNEAGARFDH